jgi:O-antigen biosynthesis protein WbqP
MDAAARLREQDPLPVEQLRVAPQHAGHPSPRTATAPDLALVVTQRKTTAKRKRRISAGGAGPPIKRSFDVVASAAGLVLLSPLMALIWVLVVSTSPGPALHTSPRVGRFGRVFNMPKFRTMHVGGPSCAREDLNAAEQRITRIGRVLRRSGLDELPQLFSVLRGEMSLIGPRPLLINDPGARERAKFPDALDVRPGISGLAQVSGRNLVTPRRKARLDAFYARTKSLRLDALLMVRTAIVIITGKGFL